MRSGSLQGGSGAARPTDPRLRELRDLDRLAALLDTRFSIPGTRIRFGVDSLIGLVPGIGDVLVSLPALYIIVRAQRMGVPNTLLLRMAANLGIDLAVGAVPVLGDVFDVAFKANRRNVNLLKRHFGEPATAPATPRATDRQAR